MSSRDNVCQEDMPIVYPSLTAQEECQGDTPLWEDFELAFEVDFLPCLPIWTTVIGISTNHVDHYITIKCPFADRSGLAAVKRLLATKIMPQ